MDNKILIPRLFKKNKEKKVIISFKSKSNTRKRLIKKDRLFKRIFEFLIKISESFIKFIKSFTKFIKSFVSPFTRSRKFKKLFINLYKNRILKEDIKYFAKYKRIR